MSSVNLLIKIRLNRPFSLKSTRRQIESCIAVLRMYSPVLPSIPIIQGLAIELVDCTPFVVLISNDSAGGSSTQPIWVARNRVPKLTNRNLDVQITLLLSVNKN